MRHAFRALPLLCCLLTPAAPAVAQSAAMDYQTGAPLSHQNLTVFPLYATSDVDPGDDYLTFEEASKEGLLQVAELSGDSSAGSGPAPQRQRPSSERNMDQQAMQQMGEGGAARVNAVQVTNTGARPVFILAGEVILGGKQDRVIGKDTIVPPGAKAMEVAVFCVERGRWDGRTAAFQPSGSLGHSKLRDSAVFDSDQSKVWQEVSAANMKHAAQNATDTYKATLQKTAGGAQLDPYRTAIAVPLRSDAKAIGVAIAIAGEVVAIDAFANPKLFAKMRDKLLESYIVEAVGADDQGTPAPVKADAVSTFLNEAKEAAKKGKVQSGGASNQYLENDSFNGVISTEGDKPVHQYMKKK